jgi:hypothetical protein
MRLKSVRLGTNQQSLDTEIALGLAHDLPDAKTAQNWRNFSLTFGCKCEIATPERKTITQSVLLSQARVHALPEMHI